MTPRKDLLDIASLTDAEIAFVLDNAGPFKDLFKRSVKKVPTLKGQTMLTLFYEPSTRTRSSSTSANCGSCAASAPLTPPSS